jgi:hypothetical protein
VTFSLGPSVTSFALGSEVPALFRRNVLPLDVALVQVSPPDKHGAFQKARNNSHLSAHEVCHELRCVAV